MLQSRPESRSEGIVLQFDSQKFFGFCESGGKKIFFHVRDFHKISLDDPGPIIGERVSLDPVQGDRGLFARSVLRIDKPKELTGKVRSYDQNKGWGFIEGPSGVFFLHRSDLARLWVPVVGNAVTFYSGESNDKPRACWVRP